MKRLMKGTLISLFLLTSLVVVERNTLDINKVTQFNNSFYESTLKDERNITDDNLENTLENRVQDFSIDVINPDKGSDQTADGTVNIFSKYIESVEKVELIKNEVNTTWEEKDDGIFDKGDKDDELLHLKEIDTGKVLEPDAKIDITSNNSSSNPLKFNIGESATGHSACYNKVSVVSIWWDPLEETKVLRENGEEIITKGKIHVRESNRVVGYGYPYSKIDYHINGWNGSDEKLKNRINSSKYSFRVTFRDVYDISKEDYIGEENKYINSTNRNFIPSEEVIYTGQNNGSGSTYSEVEKDLRTSLRSKYHNPKYGPLGDSVGIKFFKDVEGKEEIINKDTFLSDDELYVQFYDKGINDDVYNQSEIINYSIPFIEHWYIENENGYNSFGNLSASKINGKFANNNISIQTNYKLSFGVGSENIEKVYLDGPGVSKEIIPDGEWYNQNITEVGEYEYRIVFDEKLYSKPDNHNHGSENELIIDIDYKDGNTFFNNKDIKNSNDEIIEHNYGIYDNTLSEYYVSNDIFKFKGDFNSHNYLFSDDYIKQENGYKGRLYKNIKGDKWDSSSFEEVTNLEEFHVNPGNEIIIGDINSKEDILYKYVIEDVFGYEYIYYFETDPSNNGSSFGMEKYSQTEEGKELLKYYLYNNVDPDITGLDSIQNRFNYKDVESERVELIGKRNMSYYLLDNDYISEFIGKVEYGTKLSEVEENLYKGISSDVIKQGYDKDSFEIELKTDSSFEIIDNSRISIHIWGKQGSNTYQEIYTEYSPEIIKNLSKLKIDNKILSSITGRFNQDIAFKQGIQPVLDGNIFDQSSKGENSYFNINSDVDQNHDGIRDIKIEWTLPLLENNEIKYGDIVSYKVTSTNKDYYVNGIEGNFESKVYLSLSGVWINNTPLIEQTYLYEEGTFFEEMRGGFEDSIKKELRLRGIKWDEVVISWEVNGEDVDTSTVVNKGDTIEYEIQSSGNSDRIRDIKSSNFIARNYISISTIKIDTKELDNYLMKYYEGIEFNVVKDGLESLIRHQIDNQIGSKYSKYIDINWFVGFDEIIYPGMNISFTIESNSSIEVHNDNNTIYKIQFRNKEIEKDNTILIIVISSIILIFALSALALLLKIFN